MRPLCVGSKVEIFSPSFVYTHWWLVLCDIWTFPAVIQCHIFLSACLMFILDIECDWNWIEWQVDSSSRWSRQLCSVQSFQQEAASQRFEYFVNTQNIWPVKGAVKVQQVSIWSEEPSHNSPTTPQLSEIDIWLMAIMFEIQIKWGGNSASACGYHSW